MADQFDMLFEQAMCDHWWVQDNAQVVKKPDYEYLKSRKDHRLYNAVIRVSPKTIQYQQLIDEVMLAHKGKGSEWRIGAPSYTTELEKAVLSAGYKVDGAADAWTIQVDADRPSVPSSIVVKRVATLQDMRDMYDIMNQSFDKSNPTEDSELTKQLQMCTGTNARCLRFVAYDKKTNQPLSTGGLNIYPELAVGFMWGGCTVPQARGRGVYSAVVTHRMLHAQKRGIARIGLYAIRDTSGPIVKSQGFDKHGPIYFWGRDHTP